MTVDPVVVTPDIASKNESVNDMSRSLKANGSAANSAISTQQVDVSTKVCRRPRRSGPCRFVQTSSTPANRVTLDEATNMRQTPCPTAKSTSAGGGTATARGPDRPEARRGGEGSVTTVSVGWERTHNTNKTTN